VIRTKTIRSGFTLVEVMISSAISAVVMAAVFSTYNFLGRNLARLSSYQALENESRKALSYLSRDFTLAQGVKTGTSPTTSTVTLILPSGEVTYYFNSASHSLRRQANFGPSPDLSLLRNSLCECTTFEFRYFTTTDGAPSDQTAPSGNVPYSIKQIQVRYVVESPASWLAMSRTRYEAVSARYYFRNRGVPDGI
jgi:prepilin-type N-terminal cleavage/methylation domain-containing protein